MEDFYASSMSNANTSLMRIRDVTTTVLTIDVTIQNATKNITSNAYEWRFVVPPYFLIFALSISGNCLVIATLASNRRMRTITNIYLLNLAISDFLLGVFCMPFTLVGQIYRRFIFGAVMCKLVSYMQAVSISVDVWTLVAISLERYFAICRPLKSRKWQTQCHAYKMIAVVWIFSFIYNSPILLVTTLLPMSGNAFKCREDWSSLNLKRIFSLSLDGALLIIPMFIISFAYSLIVSKLWRGMRNEIQHNFKRQQLRSQSCNHLLPTTPILHANTEVNTKPSWSFRKIDKNVDKDSQPQSYCLHAELDFRHVVRSTHIDKSIEAKRKVIRMLFVIIIEFFVCWTPLHVINTIHLFYPEELYEYISPKGISCLQLLGFCSSCCNPITYCFMNRKFRQGFLGLLQNCRLFRGCFAQKCELKQVTPPPSSQESLMDWKGRIVFSSGSQSTTLASVTHHALPAAVVTRHVTQVIETGEEGSQFLYRITWPRSGQSKTTVSSQPLYE